MFTNGLTVSELSANLQKLLKMYTLKYFDNIEDRSRREVVGRTIGDDLYRNGNLGLALIVYQAIKDTQRIRNVTHDLSLIKHRPTH